MKTHFAAFIAASILAASLSSPESLRACGCGCGLFDVQSSAMTSDGDHVYPLESGASAPVRAGGFAYLEYDDVNQNQNWHGHRSVSNDDNADKLVRTELVTLGTQYVREDGWGAIAELPVWNRLFRTLDDDGNPTSAHDTSVGDVRLRGVYSGFSSERRTGVTFGAKLPTGHTKAAGFDRDTQIGTGSTDLLLGLYHLGRIAADARWMWFGNLLWDQPLLTAGGYRPGNELNAALGASFRGWRISGVRVAPLAQAILSVRGHDTGTFAHFDDTGYTRWLAAPGLQVAAGRFVATASVGFPVAQTVNGNQLMASQYWRLSTGIRF